MGEGGHRLKAPAARVTIRISSPNLRPSSHNGGTGFPPLPNLRLSKRLLRLTVFLGKLIVESRVIFCQVSVLLFPGKREGAELRHAESISKTGAGSENPQ
jgi:hypothetical protein